MRPLQRLSAKAVANLKQAGYWCDGGGLYLQVTATRAKSWIFRYTRRGREHQMGLGSERAVTLAQARRKAAEARTLLAEGIDPLEARNAKNSKAKLADARAISFAQCAEKFIAAHRAGWRNEKHVAQWTNTVETYCRPVFGALPVADVDTALVVKVLEPIWTKKPETASRLRARIERVIDWATVRGFRAGDNPARWRGHLDKVLPALKKKARVKHHPALPYAEIGAFMEQLRTEEGTAARALEFAVLSACRTGEVIGARREEFDLEKKIWTIPATRMKAGREHRVPLSARAVEIVRAQPNDGYVFPGLKKDEPLSNMAMLALLRRIGRDDITVHGFRSSFRDWAAESTNYAREVCEAALAHTLSDAVEAAYRRGDLFEKRRRLMDDWNKLCAQRAKPGKVIAIRKAREAKP